MRKLMNDTHLILIINQVNESQEFKFLITKITRKSIHNTLPINYYNGSESIASKKLNKSILISINLELFKKDYVRIFKNYYSDEIFKLYTEYYLLTQIVYHYKLSFKSLDGIKLNTYINDCVYNILKEKYIDDTPELEIIDIISIGYILNKINEVQTEIETMIKDTNYSRRSIHILMDKEFNENKNLYIISKTGYYVDSNNKIVLRPKI